MTRIPLILILIFLLNMGLSQNKTNNLFSEKKLIQFNIDNWNREDGLPTNSLIDICQTDDGYIWISSYSGLIRFDGVNFTVFDKSNTSVFKENGLGALAKDSKGNLWITTQSSGLISYKNGKFKSFGSNRNIEHLFAVIYIDSKDRIWSSSSEGGWFVYDNNSFQFLKHSTSPENIDLQSVYESKDGTVWFGTAGKGLFEYKNHKFTVYTTENGLPSNWVRSVFIDENDLLWVGTDNGVCTFNRKDFAIIPELKDFTINKIISDKLGNLWFATVKGLFRKNNASGDYEHLSTDNGLINNYINNFLIDFENSLWLINYKAGLSRIKNSKFITYSNEKGLPGTIVNSVCEYNTGTYLAAFDNGYISIIENGVISEFRTKNSLIGTRIRHIKKDSKNNLWISTYSGLLKILPNKEEIWYKEENGFPGKYIRLTFEDSKNNIWVGTRNSGLIKINKDNTFKVFNKSNDLSSNLIMSINEDKSGNIYVGTSKGGINVIFNDEVIRKYTKEDGLTGDIIFNTNFDRAGYMWIATNGGLNCFKDNQFLSYRTNETELNFAPFDIIEDNYGNFWMSSEKGIITVNRQCLLDYANKRTDSCTYKLYDKHDGIKQPECTSTANSLKGSDGSLWFPTIDGITTINPNDISVNNYIPPVYIEKLLVDNININISETIKIKTGKKRITFYYTALSYHEPNNVLFKYKLEGFEDRWSEADTKRTISYTNLPPGNYIFKVIACNNDELWNTEGSQIKFTVTPRFHQTIWFFFLIGFVIIMFGILIYKIRVRYYKKEQKKLERIVKERTIEITEKNKEISEKNEELIQYQNHLEVMIRERTNDLEIAKLNAEKADQLKTSFLENLSHEIRTPLNAIVGFSALLENDEKLSENAKESIINIMSGSNSLTKIVDSIMQASRLQLGDIELYENEFSLYELMKDLHSEFLNSTSFIKKKDLELKLYAAGVKDILITTDRDRLQTLLYNLIDNAIKFTEKGTVEFGADLEKDNILSFYVKDTGIGIAEEDLIYIFDKFRKIESDKSVLYRGLGLGLNISKSLVKLLDGKISVESAPNKGSFFSVRIPAKNLKKISAQGSDKQKIEFIDLDITGKKILIAEDEKLNLLFLETFLKKSGAKIYTAVNGLEAVYAYEQNKDIDLILMDIKMPECDGIEATRKIRNLHEGTNVKIIAQTAYTMDYQKMKILNSGFDDYIEKPIDVYMIMNLINKHLKIL